MVDLEQLYDFESAVKLGSALSNMPCDWLEAPLNDTEIDAYAELRRAVGVDIISAGNHHFCSGCWLCARIAYARTRHERFRSVTAPRKT